MVEIPLLLDSGAEISVLFWRDYALVKQISRMHNSETRLHNFDGSSLKAVGQVEYLLSLDYSEAIPASFQMVENGTSVLVVQK